jgi:hypothetical protein
MIKLKKVGTWLKKNILNILILGLAVFCLFNVFNKLDDSFTVIANSLAILLAIWYFVKFEKELLDRIIQGLIKRPSINTLQFLAKRKKGLSLLIVLTRRFLSVIIRFLYQKRWEIISYLFVLLLLIITLGQFLNWGLVEKYQTIIIILAVLSGGLTFWRNRERVEKEIEEEKNEEEKAEHKRKVEFSDKFPKINKIPILKNFVKWMYKEGWSFSIPLVLIVIIFIAIKIGIPIIFTGSYIDEYYHILSGIEFFKSGHFAEFYSGELYNRGAYISVLVGIFFKLFGQTIFVAKMVPASIGIINFFLLYKIARHVFINKKYILLLMATYTFIPWFIFNHFYIRMYVFYEFFILLLTLIFILIIKNINCTKKLIAYSTILSVIVSVVYFLSGDSGKYLILLYCIIYLTYIFFIEIKNIPIKNKIFNKYKNNQKLKIILILSIGLITATLFNIEKLFNNFFLGSLVYSSGENFKYDNLFLNLNLTFTVFFLLSILLLFFKKTNKIIKLIACSSLFLLFVHYISAPDMQITRAIIYFLPLFYLVSIFCFYAISKIYQKKFFLLIIILVFLSIYRGYPIGFISNGPYIPTEVNYIDYKKAYSYIEKGCDSVYEASPSSQIASFYNINYKKLIITNGKTLNQAYIYNKSGTNDYFNTYDNKSIETKIEAVLNNQNSKNFCIITRTPSEDYFLDKDSINLLEKKMFKQEYTNIKIYYLN